MNQTTRIITKHYRRDLLQLVPKNNKTDNEYKNDAMCKVQQEIIKLDKDATIQAIKYTILAIKGDNLNNGSLDFNSLNDEFKNNTKILDLLHNLDLVK